MGTGDNALQTTRNGNSNGDTVVLSCPHRLKLIGDGYESLLAEIEYTCKLIADIQRAGVTNATIHRRSDTGGMELLHPSDSDYVRRNGRRREYIGQDPDKQREAKQLVARFEEWQGVKNKLEGLQSKRRLIDMSIAKMETHLFGQQLSMGTEFTGEGRGLVPTLAAETPEQVIEYFKCSPVLNGMADDVEALLSPKFKKAARC